MKKVILAFESDSVCRRFRTILETGGIAVREQHTAGSKVIRAIKTMGGGVVVCGSKLADMTAEELAQDIDGTSTVIVAARPAEMPDFNSQNIHKLPTPFSGNDLISVVRMILEVEDVQPRWSHHHRTADDERCLHTAKELLMEKNDMTEKEAHRFIQRKCMERGNRMEEVARLILEAYEAKE